MAELTFTLTDEQLAGFEAARAKTAFETVEEFVSDHVGRIGDFYFKQSKEDRVTQIADTARKAVFASDPVGEVEMAKIEAVSKASAVVVGAFATETVSTPVESLPARTLALK
jgi:hypothetical protein